MLESPLESIRGIGPVKATLLREEAGLATVEDLLYYAPRRYVDRSTFKQIRDCFEGESVTVAGRIVNVAVAGHKRKFLEVLVEDDSDSLAAVFFGAYQYFRKIFQPGESVVLSGKIGFFGKKQIVHPEFDFLDPDSVGQGINTGRIIPLYPSTEKLRQSGFDSRGFRRAVRLALDGHLHLFDESLDESLLKRRDLCGIKKAISALHFPDSPPDADQARQRLAFNEIFFLQYYLLFSKRLLREGSTKIQKAGDGSIREKFASILPFELTGDQKTALGEIINDIAAPFPMNRLLQGDVGSGKTAVAMGAMYYTARCGRQSAIMAPTDVLAQQHYRNFVSVLSSELNICLLTGATPRQERDIILNGLSDGSLDAVIGTHALIQDTVEFKDLGLIVIDEQHRFGVEQRSALRDKGQDVDLLVMTATPIPRSLSLTLYGDLDLSVIRTKPKGRMPIKTLAFPDSRLPGVFNSLEKYMSQGRQIYYVLPLIEESEKSDLKSAMAVYDHLKDTVFPHRRIEILHGRMKQAEKDAIMKRFVEKEVDLLVSTTIIEVGIDVPNANVIVIEHAERFGLSQLHQLRGRVGRGAHESFCILVHSPDLSEMASRRIKTIEETDDGFKIAEEDLKLRGAGEFIGSRQHGYASGFEFADLSTDMGLILAAREEAAAILEADRDGTSLQHFRNRRYEEIFKGIRKKKILSILS